MMNFKSLVFVLLLMAASAQAELKRVEMTVFGMD
jgi:hypothetical protein